jgi:tetratricopeptide (TPR) repeat protein
MLFAHLRHSDEVLLEKTLLDEQGRDDVLAELLAYLLMWAPDQWIDEEKIYFLGKDIARICPSDFRNTLIEEVRKRVPAAVANIFLAGFERPAAKADRVTRPPALTQLGKLLSRLKNEIGPPIEPAVEAIVNRYIAFAESGGDPGPLVNAIGQIGGTLVNVSGPMRPWAANLTRRLVQKGLKWAPDSERLWGLWGRSLAKAGAFEAAELVYWNAIRQFPWNPYLRSQLIEVVKRQRKFGDALSLAWESFQIFPDSPFITVQLAILLGQSKDGDSISKAINILSARIERIAKVVLETSALASILANAAEANVLADRDIELVVSRLRKKPQLLGAMSHRLINDHKAFNLVQRLWRRRVALAPNDAITRSQLAKAYVSSGSEADMAEALRILWAARRDFPENTSIRSYLARLLALTGGSEGRDEGIQLLRDTMTIVEDIHTIIQLAELLALRGSPTDRQEAVSLLQQTLVMDPHNKYARNLLASILRTLDGTDIPTEVTSDGTDIPTEVAIEKPIQIFDDEELTHVEEHEFSLEEVIPANIAKWGAARRLRFKLDNGSDAEKKAALEGVRQMLQDAPFAYAKLLAVRQGIWNEEGSGMNAFSFAFERALRDHDQSTLKILSERFPRLSALTIVAQAMFGDTLSAAKIANLMSAEDEALHPAARALKRRIRPHLALIEGGASPERVVAERKSEILLALYDASESALYERAA